MTSGKRGSDPFRCADASGVMPPRRVEIVIGARALLTVLGFALLVVLAILSLGSLLSIFLGAHSLAPLAGTEAVR
jgi:hypothetical protein